MFRLSAFLVLGVLVLPLMGQIYEPHWNSLKRHQTPAWMEDAKFGIYCHWGLTTVKQLPGIGMRNMENGLLRDLAYDPWMTDIDINIHGAGTSWFYSEGAKVKNADYIIDVLADVVSKNGRVLLNVPPKEDGTFSEEIRYELLEVGSWLQVNMPAEKISDYAVTVKFTLL